jgi:hypothetical protein
LRCASPPAKLDPGLETIVAKSVCQHRQGGWIVAVESFQTGVDISSYAVVLLVVAKLVYGEAFPIYHGLAFVIEAYPHLILLAGADEVAAPQADSVVIEDCQCRPARLIEASSNKSFLVATR